MTLDRQSFGLLEFLLATHSLIKIIVFFLLWTLIWLAITIPLSKITKWHPHKPAFKEQKLPILLTLYGVAPLAVWIAASAEGATFADYGLNWQPTWLSLAWGVSLGVGGVVLIFALQGWLGWVQWHSQLQRLWVILPLLGLGLGVGLIEELVFRGFLINELLQDYSLGAAAAIASLIFALSHLVWEQQQTKPQLPGLWLMGMVLVGARWADGGSLALAWGLHAGWIWGLSALDSAKLISYTGKASDWITGVGEQPLAGTAGILCLAGTGAFLWLLS